MQPLVKNLAVILATLGIAFPQLPAFANERDSAPKTRVKVSQNSVLDVRLGKDGSLTGRTLNHQGVAQVGAKIVVRQGTTEVAESATDEHGNFAVKGLKSGVYQVASGTTVGTYRVWSDKAAPPATMPHCLLILGENGARGQYGLTETIVGQNLGLILLASTTGLALAGLLVSLQAEHVARDAQKAAAAALTKSP